MKNPEELPLIGIPLGDPAGIGPEIVVKALSEPQINAVSRPVIFGDCKLLQQTANALATDLHFFPAAAGQKFYPAAKGFPVVEIEGAESEKIIPGRVSAAGGSYAHACIVNATMAAMSGLVDAIATTPINKESIKAAKIDFIGHTEMLAALTGVNNPMTMFQTRNLRVFFFSRHLSLRQACDAITKDRLVECLQECDHALRRLKESSRKIAVAGLNPHCGEHGLFGSEEGREIEPAIAEARKLGIDAVGPVSADSVFHQALQGRFDAVLSLYHDQGHIATKTLDFERTISVTLGLPFIRTSVDHGTAFDIAGQGKASAVSMIEAIRLAAVYSFKYRQK